MQVAGANNSTEPAAEAPLGAAGIFRRRGRNAYIGARTSRREPKLGIVLVAGAELESFMGILWTIIIGFVAGVIARFFHPGNKYEPKGFILTTVLGIIGAVVATYLGQAVGWYHEGESAGFIASIVGAIIVLVIWGLIAPRLERT